MQSAELGRSGLRWLAASGCRSAAVAVRLPYGTEALFTEIRGLTFVSTYKMDYAFVLLGYKTFVSQSASGEIVRRLAGRHRQTTGRPKMEQDKRKRKETKRDPSVTSLGSLAALAVAGLDRVVSVLLQCNVRFKSYLLLDLQTVNHRSQLTENLVGPLVELQLCGDQIGQVSQGLGRVEDLMERYSQQTGFPLSSDRRMRDLHSSSR